MGEDEKTYAKKYKINSILNELYTELTKNKPDNPIEFAIKHFEAKLPPPSIATAALRQSTTLKTKDEERKDSVNEADGIQLLNRMMNAKSLFGGANQAIDEGDDNSAAGDAAAAKKIELTGLNAFTKLNILNRINRVLVDKSKHMTDEELLEKEKIYFYAKDGHESSRQGEGGGDQKPKKIITYKSDLVNRDKSEKHKKELKRLIENEKNKFNSDDKTRGAAGDNEFIKEEETGIDLAYLELKVKQMDMAEGDSEHNQELLNEVLLPNKINRSVEKQEEAKRNRKLLIRDMSRIDGSGQHHRHHGGHHRMYAAAAAAVSPQFVICPICKRIQNQDAQTAVDPSSKHDETTSDEVKTLTNEQEAAAATKRPATSKTDHMEKEANEKIRPLENKADGPSKTNDSSKQAIFDLLLSRDFTDPTPTKQKTEHHIDDDAIESASQVSGPRSITPYEANTNRTVTRKSSEEEMPKHYDGDVLNWIMDRQKEATKSSKNTDELVERHSSTSSSNLRRKQQEPEHAVLDEALMRSGGEKAANVSARSSGSRVSHRASGHQSPLITSPKGAAAASHVSSRADSKAAADKAKWKLRDSSSESDASFQRKTTKINHQIIK